MSVLVEAQNVEVHETIRYNHRMDEDYFYHCSEKNNELVLFAVFYSH